MRGDFAAPPLPPEGTGITCPGTKRRFPTRVRSGRAGLRCPPCPGHLRPARRGATRLPRAPFARRLRKGLPGRQFCRASWAARGGPNLRGPRDAGPAGRGAPSYRLCPAAPALVPPRPPRERPKEPRSPQGGELVGCGLWGLFKAGAKDTSRDS